MGGGGGGGVVRSQKIGLSFVERFVLIQHQSVEVSLYLYYALCMDQKCMCYAKSGGYMQGHREFSRKNHLCSQL